MLMVINMRLDKYLKVSRIIKRRTVSHDLAEASRVLVNGKLAKPGLKLKVNDLIELALGDKIITFKVYHTFIFFQTTIGFVWSFLLPNHFLFYRYRFRLVFPFL
jgi:16S rRNA U516 pseudouridylate synthase RsuA-like enzyme